MKKFHAGFFITFNNLIYNKNDFNYPFFLFSRKI
jgi:hypothetical protein